MDKRIYKYKSLYVLVGYAELKHELNQTSSSELSNFQQ